MSKTIDLPFNGGAVVDPSGKTPSAQVHTVFLRKIDVVDAGHELRVYALFDRSKPTTVAPFFEPVSAYNLAEWCARGDVVQVDLSEALDRDSNTYTGLLQEVTLETDEVSGPYVSECTLRAMEKRNNTGVRFSWFWLCLLMDQDTGITYLATPVLNNPVTLDVPDHKVQVEQTDTPNYLVNKISGDGETIGVEVVRQNALGNPIDPFLRIKSIEPRQTPLEGYSDLYGIGLKTNSFGQVTEITDGTQQSFTIDTGVYSPSHLLTASEIAQGYYDIRIGLSGLIVRGKRIPIDSLLIDRCEILTCINQAVYSDYDEDRQYSVNRLEVLLDAINLNNPYYANYVCHVDDFTKDEFGRLIPNDFIGSNLNEYRYNYLRTPFRTYGNQYIRGFIVRNYINTDYARGTPIVPDVRWHGPRVYITVSAKTTSMLDLVANLPIVSEPNTLRFRFSDPSYSPVNAGVGTSGTYWTKREEFTENVWDWTNYNSDWSAAFHNAWTSEGLGTESVRLVAAGDTSAVTNVQNLFSECSALRSAVAFDTSNVTAFNMMFAQCTNLEGVPYFNTDSATDVTMMFNGCSQVRSGALALYTRMSGQTTPPSSHTYAFKDCGKDTTAGLAELQQIPASWGGLAP